MANYVVSDTNLTAIADAIRLKGGTSASLSFPSGMTAAIAAIETGGNSESYEWEQVPTLVKNYINNVTYSPSDYTTSQIASYAPSVADQNNAKPIGKTITTDGGTLNRNGYESNVASGNTTIYNDVPNKITDYAVYDDGVVTQTGTIKPSGALRWINCPAATNVRDLGGWSCDAGTIKHGLLYRGGIVTSADHEVLVNQLGVCADLDLRGSDVSETSSALGDDVHYYRNAIYNWYSLVNTSSWHDNLRYIFDRTNYGIPLYFHCAAGADRTGTLACVLEAILGMSQSDIDKDYELTTFSTGSGSDETARRRNETNWIGLINEINAKSGSTFRNKVLNFVLTLGFEADDINNFRNAMIVGTPDTAVYKISVTSEGCTVGNSKTAIVTGETYTATVTPTEGYNMDTVTITMGGVDVSNCYSDGTITIPSVTGDVVVNAIARTAVITYIPCAWIMQDSTGYVDTGYVNTENTGISVKFAMGESKSSIRGIAGNNDISIGGGISTDTRAYWGGVKSYQLSTGLGDTEHVISCNYLGDSVAKIDGTTKAWNAGTKTFAKSNTITLCKVNGGSVLQDTAKIKFSEIYISEGASMVKHYVSAYRSNDGVIGILETIGNTFIAATGTFTKGSDID